MPGADFRNHTDAQLAEHADDGLRGLGAVVEALRRHREATYSLDRKMWWLGIIGAALTFVGVVLAFVQVWVAVR